MATIPRAFHLYGTESNAELSSFLNTDQFSSTFSFCRAKHGALLDPIPNPKCAAIYTS